MNPDNGPTVLTLRSEGWGARHIIWESEERVLIRGSGCGPSQNGDEKWRPSDEDWSLFWRILDNLGAWEWQGHHAKEIVCDGGDWFLSIRHQGRSLEAQGMHLDRLPHFFESFERSLNALAGIPRWSPIFRSGVDGVERLDDLLSLTEAVRSLRMADERVSALVVENIEGVGNGGQTLCDILAEMGPARMTVLPALMNHLEGDTDRTYWNVRALAAFGPDAASALSALLKLLESTSDSHIAQAVTDVIIGIDADAPQLSARLPALLSSANYLSRSEALRIVSAARMRDEESLTALVDLFGNPDPQISASVDSAVQKIGEDPKRLLAFLHRPAGTSTVLVTGLRHSSSSIRRITLTWLGMVGELARNELCRAAALLEDPDDSVRRAAIVAFSQVATTKEVIGLMKDLVDDSRREVREFAMKELGKIGVPAQAAIPRLLWVIERAEQYEYVRAIDALEKIAGRDRAIVTECLRLLESDRPATRTAALSAVERFEDNAVDLVRFAVAGLDDTSDEVRCTAAACLGRCGGAAPDLAVPALCDALDDCATCASAANALCSLREAAVKAVPALVRALETHFDGESMNVGRFCAARALYTLSREHAERLSPELVHQITRIGHRPPIWT
jgi:HEAT repeat protein